MTNTPQITELTSKTVAFVSFTGNYMGNPQVFKDLFDKLCWWAGPKWLIGTNSTFLSAYQDDPRVTPPEKLKLEVCMTIPEDTEIQDDQVQKKVLPGGKYVVLKAELKGPEEYEPAWEQVVTWMKENNHEVDMSRPSYEIYLNNHEEHPQKHHIVEICMSTK